MKKMKAEFPNPILTETGDDYVNCSFKIILPQENVRVEDNDIVLDIQYELICDGLQQLISSSVAKVIVVVQSSAASFRRVFIFDKKRTDLCIKVGKNEVIRNIEITGFIVAAEDINSFKLEEHNYDYFKGIAFSIRKGDILAQEKGKIMNLDASELEKPLSSIFDIESCDSLEEMICSNFADEKILILVKPKVYEVYYTMKRFNNGSLRRYLSGIIIFPVLIEAIDRMLENIRCDDDARDETMFNKRWYLAIEKKLKEYNINLDEYEDSTVTIANKLLGGIVFDALASFKSTILDDENSGRDIIQLGGED